MSNVAVVSVECKGKRFPPVSRRPDSTVNDVDSDSFFYRSLLVPIAEVKYTEIIDLEHST